MTARKARATARATAKANTGVLRCAQDDGEKQATARATARARARARAKATQRSLGLGGPAVGVGLGGGAGGGGGCGWVDGLRGGVAGARARGLGSWAGGRGTAGYVRAMAAFARGKDIDGAEPGGGEAGPVFFGGVGWMHAEAVASGGVVVELSGDVGVEESSVVDEGIAAVAAIVFSLDEEGGGSELVGGVDGAEVLVVGGRAR